MAMVAFFPANQNVNVVRIIQAWARRVMASLHGVYTLLFWTLTRTLSGQVDRCGCVGMCDHVLQSRGPVARTLWVDGASPFQLGPFYCGVAYRGRGLGKSPAPVGAPGLSLCSLGPWHMVRVPWGARASLRGPHPRFAQPAGSLDAFVASTLQVFEDAHGYRRNFLSLQAWWITCNSANTRTLGGGSDGGHPRTRGTTCTTRCCKRRLTRAWSYSVPVPHERGATGSSLSWTLPPSPQKATARDRAL